MASLKAPVQFRLTRAGRLTLKFATLAHRCGFKMPHGLVKAITRRCWQMRLGEGEWRSIRMAPGGRVLA
jgi:hypothetical protein